MILEISDTRKWINIKDKLPPLHEEVLFYMPSIDETLDESNYVVGYLENDGNIYFNNYGESIEAASIEYVTHWLPLPDAPDG